MEKVKVLIMADSGGAGLEKRIRAEISKNHANLHNRLDLTVRPMGGAHVEDIIHKMDQVLPDSELFYIIYTSVGVNNLTSKKWNGKVAPNFNNVPEIVESLTDGYTKLKSELKTRTNQVVVCQIVGLDIDLYNGYNDEGYWYYQQEVINEAMPILAHTLNFINRSDAVKGPWITNTIHDFVNHKLYNRYAKL